MSNTVVIPPNVTFENGVQGPLGTVTQQPGTVPAEGIVSSNQQQGVNDSVASQLASLTASVSKLKTVSVVFLGNGSVIFPAGVTQATFKGIGGGGGGGGGGGTNGANIGSGGAGGGAAAQREITVDVTAGVQYDVAIGTGGAGGIGQNAASGTEGSPGTPTLVTNHATGDVLVGFMGASGGSHGYTPDAGTTPGGFGAVANGGVNIYDSGASLGLALAPAAGVAMVLPRSGGLGATGGGAGKQGGADQSLDGSVTVMTVFSGGLGGAGGGAGNGGGGGGGGSSALGVGGTGGIGAAGIPTAGASPAANTGAGGGGGGGSGPGGVTGANGAAGASGRLEVFYTITS